MKLIIRQKKKYWKQSYFDINDTYNIDYSWDNEILRIKSVITKLPYISYEAIERLRSIYGDTDN